MANGDAMDPFSEFLDRARERIASRAYPNEASVRSQIVLPLLGYAGWDIEEPAEVHFERYLSRAFIDVALMVDGVMTIVIETKKPGHETPRAKSRTIAQLLKLHAKCPTSRLLLITDGETWHEVDAATEAVIKTWQLTASPKSVEKLLRRYLDRSHYSRAAAHRRPPAPVHSRAPMRRGLPEYASDLNRAIDHTVFEALAAQVRVKPSPSSSGQSYRFFPCHLPRGLGAIQVRVTPRIADEMWEVAVCSMNRGQQRRLNEHREGLVSHVKNRGPAHEEDVDRLGTGARDKPWRRYYGWRIATGGRTTPDFIRLLAEAIADLTDFAHTLFPRAA
jgi:hypothetical protein